MSKTKTSERLFLGTLDRFGYELTVIAHTEEECKKALMKEYLRVFKRDNPNLNPKKDLWDERYSDMTFYEAAMNDIGFVEMEVGKVEWL